MLKFLLLGISAAIAAAPAYAQSAELACSMSPEDAQAMVQALGPGYADNAKQVMHLRVDEHARQVTVWESSPGDPDTSKTTYKAEFAGTTTSWAIGDPEDGPQAHESIDSSTNVLTTVDPEGQATQWNCSGS